VTYAPSYLVFADVSDIVKVDAEAERDNKTSEIDEDDKIIAKIIC